MKGAKKHFSRALTLLLSVLIMLQTVTVPAFAAENATENVEVATNDASTEEESTFNLIKADVQIDDEFKSILQVKRMRSTRITKRFLL